MEEVIREIRQEEYAVTSLLNRVEDSNLESLWNRLDKVAGELEAGGLCEEEEGFLLQRASHLIKELRDRYRVITTI